MFEFLQHQRDESTEARGQKYHGRKIGSQKRNIGITKERTLVLQAFNKKRSVNE